MCRRWFILRDIQATLLPAGGDCDQQQRHQDEKTHAETCSYKAVGIIAMRIGLREPLMTAVVGFIALLLMLLLGGQQAAADPLYAKDLSPVSGLFGFPVMRNALTLAPGQVSAALHSSVANNYSADFGGLEAVNLDGETFRVAARLAVGLGKNWELEAEVPWLRHHGGELDATIENWHDFWGLPDGNRDEVARDLINFSYTGPAARFAMRRDVEGWGDISLALVRQLWQDEDQNLSLRAGVKLGTGDADELLGSGSEDYYLSLNYSAGQSAGLPLLWHAQAGYLRAGDAGVIDAIQQRELWFAGLGLEWVGWHRLRLKLQLDSHAAPTDSQVDQLGATSVQLSAGVDWLLSPDWSAEFSFSEDIAVDTAPDFVVQLGLRYRPSAR